MVKKIDPRKLTTLRKEEYFKKKRAEESERLSVIGQESDTRAAKWVREDASEKEKEDNLAKEQALFQLERFRKDKFTYNKFLLQVFLRFVNDEAISPNYKIWARFNKIGITIGIAGTKFYGAFKACGIAKYDFFACKALAVELGNTIAHLDGYRRQSAEGVLFPDQEDLKNYGK